MEKIIESILLSIIFSIDDLFLCDRLEASIIRSYQFSAYDSFKQFQSTLDFFLISFKFIFQ